MTKAVLPNMYKNKSGLIINVCSQASFDNDDLNGQCVDLTDLFKETLAKKVSK